VTFNNLKTHESRVASGLPWAGADPNGGLMKRRWLLVPLAIAGCGTSSMDLGIASEADELADTTQLLGERVQQEFGAGARVQAIFGAGDKVLVGVATEEATPESDLISPMAFASLDKRTYELSVLTREVAFSSATVLPDGLATISESGDLKVGDQVLATGATGDVAASLDGQTLLFTRANETDGVVALTNRAGAMKELTDGDRPALSPDGRTVIFVSARTGVAGLYRTTIDGDEPVQITNANIEMGLERDGDPEGFVPPPVNGSRIAWVDAKTVRYDAGGGDWWKVDVFSGAATRMGGAQ
jgi:hypothetical protein